MGPGQLSEPMLVVFCTFPDLEKAREVGGALVAKKLAACVSLLPGVESIYAWDGGIQNDSEVLAIFKLAGEVFEAFEQALKKLHPYDVPEIVAMEPSQISVEYLKWVGESCGR